MIAAVLRVLTCLALVLGTALCAAAFAVDLPLRTPLTADLDADASDEIIRARETACYGPGEPTPPPCPPEGLRSLLIEVADNCVGGEHVLKLSREMDYITFARLLDADNDGTARELAFELRAGASGRGVQAKVVRFRAGTGGCVAVQKTLFSYPQPATIGRRPKGTAFQSGSLQIRDYRKATKGLELRTAESYLRPTDAGCCPSFNRVTYWRLSSARNGYRPYKTTLTKLPRQPT